MNTDIGSAPHRLRIAHLILSRGFAGSERSTAESCNAQAEEHEVMLIVRADHRSRAGASIKDHLDPRVRVEEVPARLFTGRRVSQVLQSFRPHIAHAHLRRATRLLSNSGSAAKQVATLHLHINGKQFLEMDALVCIAHWQTSTVPSTYRGKAVVVPESLIPHRRLQPNEVMRLRDQLGVGEDEFLIGGVGRMAHSKGWDVLLKAFARSNLEHTKLVLIGEGRERRKLMAMAGTNVQFLGHRDDVKDFYQAFDLFVCPSRREPLGRVVLEALDAAVPVVASAAQGPREMLSEYPGDLFPIEDVDALAAALQKNRALGRRRVEVDLSKHHLSAVNAQLVALYRSLLNDG